MRSGGDAGTAIHTSVPFGIAAIRDFVSIAVEALAGGAAPPTGGRAAAYPAPHQERYSGGSMTTGYASSGSNS